MAGNWNSGRRKTPPHLKVLRGNPGRRRFTTPPPAPALDEAFDIPPAILGTHGHAHNEWKRLAPILRDAGLVTEAERSALISLCLEWAAYLDAKARARRQVKVKDASRYLLMADRALNQCRYFWKELGLTPSGRAVPTAGRRAPDVTPAPSKWGSIL